MNGSNLLLYFKHLMNNLTKSLIKNLLTKIANSSYNKIVPSLKIIKSRNYAKYQTAANQKYL